jgi:hypothetical protein
MAGVLATTGNLVFLGHYDGTFSAYDAKTLNEAWSFNVGSPIQAPPVSYSVNGKQYVAVLVGARMWPFIVENAPELKNQTTGRCCTSSVCNRLPISLDCHRYAFCVLVTRFAKASYVS